ncbi:MAG: TIGR01244 family sulfur transferase [Caulobacteraceae bacterium]
MSDFRAVTEAFSVSPQISIADVAEAARQGFTRIINNRPDGEAADQPSSQEIAAAAKAAGIAYVDNPIVGRPSAGQAAEQSRAATAGGRTLAFCRSGTRSIAAWAMGELAAGRSSRVELLTLAQAAGYDLSLVLSS